MLSTYAYTTLVVVKFLAVQYTSSLTLIGFCSGIGLCREYTCISEGTSEVGVTKEIYRSLHVPFERAAVLCIRPST
jgi:hypothetical protein